MNRNMKKKRTNGTLFAVVDTQDILGDLLTDVDNQGHHELQQLTSRLEDRKKEQQLRSQILEEERHQKSRQTLLAEQERQHHLARRRAAIIESLQPVREEAPNTPQTSPSPRPVQPSVPDVPPTPTSKPPAPRHNYTGLAIAACLLALLSLVGLGWTLANHSDDIPTTYQTASTITLTSAGQSPLSTAALRPLPVVAEEEPEPARPERVERPERSERTERPERPEPEPEPASIPTLEELMESEQAIFSAGAEREGRR